MARGAKKKLTGTDLGYEAQLWKTADALRNNMDAAEYKQVVLGLIFLKYISDAFEAKHAALEAERNQEAGPEDRDKYLAKNIFWVPKEIRWAHLKASAPQPKIGQIVDEAMAAIERDNPSLKGVLPKDYGHESNYATWRLAKMNLAIRGIDAQIAHGDTFHNGRHPDLKADFELTRPPFNDSDWRGELLEEGRDWVYGVPRAGNARNEVGRWA